MKKFNIWFDRVFSKNVVLAFSAIYVGAVYFFIIKNAPPVCQYGWCYDQTSSTLLPLYHSAIVIFSFTLLTYLLRDLIFKTWIRFAVAWLVISYIWIVITPHDTSQALGIDKKPVLAVFLAALFCLLSLILIIVRAAQEYLIKK